MDASATHSGQSPDRLHGALRLTSAQRRDWHALRDGDHHEPHKLLGAHPATHEGRHGVIVRAFHPDATMVELLPSQGAAMAMSPAAEGGFFAVFVEGATMPFAYRLRFRFADGAAWEREDPYRFLPAVGEIDLHLLAEGTHRRLWQCLGAVRRTMDGVEGTAFAVWAPNARRVSVVGDFCNWDGRLMPMRSLGSSGVYELFVPGAANGAFYKYEIKTQDGHLRIKADPMARCAEHPPGDASRVSASTHRWGDAEWMDRRGRAEPYREPMAIYEVHLGSWRRVPEEGNRPLTYRELAPLLVAHVRRYRFTHIELLPVAEHPFDGSWGYQVTGYFAPTARYGSPDDFRFFVDYCHRHGVGVIVDWVPAHFPKDDWALRRFDGTALYEHEDPRQGEHPDWGTLIFNYARNEVRSFLLSNALYWLHEFHIDGLRVDAVSSMLYLDYSRPADGWIPNRYGGKENLEAISLLQSINAAVREECPGALMIAEESTGWLGVTHPADWHGLGFTYKWNMGWMHDTLTYFSKDAVHRKYHQNDLTFAMLYEYSERFLNPLSHDEVVHGKRSLLEKMPGDIWQKFANLRALLAYQYMRPGKKLLFMGTELAPWDEWRHDKSLDWHLADDPARVGLSRLLEDLGRLYAESPTLWRQEVDPGGFAWIDCSDFEQSVFSFERWGDDGSCLIVVMNLTPVPRDGYRIGATHAGRYLRLLDTDDPIYGGSGYGSPAVMESTPCPAHSREHSLVLNLPPLSVMVFRRT